MKQLKVKAVGYRLHILIAIASYGVEDKLNSTKQFMLSLHGKQMYSLKYM